MTSKWVGALGRKYEGGTAKKAVAASNAQTGLEAEQQGGFLPLSRCILLNTPFHKGTWSTHVPANVNCLLQNLCHVSASVTQLGRALACLPFN
eukprot:561737-Pelagomonas_calceolata.AAC.4